ncbi:MAG: hypothetical protein EXR72_07090 [Myxococcales bacterium]|nr:hypothetical protein [Myxococcales bacterium]
MIHVDYLDRPRSIATVPTVCRHCEDPTCAEVCPADAIKQNAEGVVMSAQKPRCIACANCVLAGPFGVPKMMVRLEQIHFGEQEVVTKVHTMAPAGRTEACSRG